MFYRILRKFSKRNKVFWENRAAQYGERSVVNLNDDRDLREITKFQWDKIEPILTKYSNLDNVKHAIDFGCGTGRFLKLISHLNYEVIGFEPVKGISHYAKIDNPEVLIISDIKQLDKSLIGKIDLIFCCLVLGGFTIKELNRTKLLFDKLLKPGGILLLAENTTEYLNDPDKFWKYRTEEYYKNLFNTLICLEKADYDEVGERVSVFLFKKYL